MTSLFGMKNLYKEAHKRGHKCLFLLSNDLNLSDKYNCIHLEENNYNLSLASKNLNRFLPSSFSKSLRYLKHLMINFLNKNYTKKIEEWVKDQRSKEKKINKIFELEKPDVVYTYGDRHSGFEPAIIKIANQKKIPVIVPPIAFFSDKESLLISARRYNSVNKQICVTNSFSFKKKYPNQWVFDRQTKKDFSYYPKWQGFAMDKLGVLPENPWIIGGGNSDIICTDGEKTKNLLLKNGVKSSKIIITGNSEHDILHSTWKDRQNIKRVVYKKYKLDPKKHLLVVALPQTFEHDLLTEKEHWKLQEAICLNSAKSNWNVLVSLHPKMDRKKYIFLEKKYGLSISDEKLRSILPLSDLFIVGQGSSTVLWSILCEVPTVVLDWYGLNYSLYDWVDGLEIIRNKDLLLKTILKLTSADSKIRDEIKGKFKKQKYLISKFDGKATDRILSHKYLV